MIDINPHIKKKGNKTQNDYKYRVFIHKMNESKRMKLKLPCSSNILLLVKWLSPFDNASAFVVEGIINIRKAHKIESSEMFVIGFICAFEPLRLWIGWWSDKQDGDIKWILILKNTLILLLTIMSLVFANVAKTWEVCEKINTFFLT